MKKWLVILAVMLVVIVGCSKKEEGGKFKRDEENANKWAQYFEELVDEYEDVLFPKITEDEFYNDINFTYTFGGERARTFIEYSLDKEEKRSYSLTISPAILEIEDEFDYLMGVSDTSVEIKRDGWLAGYDPLNEHRRRVIAIKDDYVYEWFISDDEVTDNEALVHQEIDRLTTNEDTIKILEEIQENIVNKLLYMPFEEMKEKVGINFGKNYRVDEYNARMEIIYDESSGVFTQIKFISKEQFKRESVDDEKLATLKTKNEIEVEKHEIPGQGPERIYYSLPVDDYMYKVQVVDFDGTFDWDEEDEVVLEVIDHLQ